VESNKLTPLPLRINYFSFVAIGRFISEPLINTVTPNHFASVSQAFDHLQGLWYRRVGLALHERLNQHVDDRFRAALVGRQAEMPASQRVPPLLYPDIDNEAHTIIRWFKREQPDVVLSYNHIYPMLEDAGLRIPDEAAFASLNLNRRFEGQLAGTNINDRMVGQAAVDQLNSQLLVGEIGLPEDWSAIAVVNAGAPSIEPRANWVGYDVARAVLEGYDHLCASGFEEIGMILDPAFNEWFQHRPAAAFLQAQLDHGRATPRLARLETEARASWEPWEAQTQAVLVCHPPSEQREALETHYAPEALCEIGPNDAIRDHATLAQASGEIGRTAIETLTQQLFLNERGLPSFPHSIQIPAHRVLSHPAVRVSTPQLAYA